MRILLTGGAGFIGSHLSERLLREGPKLAIVDDLNDFYSPSAFAPKRKDCISETRLNVLPAASRAWIHTLLPGRSTTVQLPAPRLRQSARRLGSRLTGGCP